MKVAFEKWEGLGNDFVLIDRRALGRDLSSDEARSVCDRRTGIGADGVLLIDRPQGVSGSMVVLNADGTRPEMCGNGLRCVAGFLSAGGGSASMMVRTDTGDLGCVVEACAEGLVEVEIAMGVARFHGDLVVPIRDDAGSVSNHLFERVSMGNPHAITFDPSEGATFDRVAPIVEKTLSGGTNVELVHMEGDVLVVRVWERGVGYTLACGTGACAAAAAACRRGLTPFGRDTTVRLPGGHLVIRVDESTLQVTMRGPARRVFQGEISLF